MKPTFESPDGAVKLYLGDCLEIAPMISGVDAVITDPPYSAITHSGHDATSKGHQGQGKDSFNRQSLNYAPWTAEDCHNAAVAFNAVCNGWVVWMTDHTLAPAIMAEQESLGRYVFAPLPFFAPGSRVRLSGDGPSSWTVWIIVSRTKRQSKWGTLPGGYVSGVGWNDKIHMGGKPTMLMQLLALDYSRPDDTVLDPCMGSGTTGIACIRTGRKFIGIEKDPTHYATAEARIRRELDQFKLPIFDTEKYEQQTF